MEIEDIPDEDTVSRSVTKRPCEVDEETLLISNMFPSLSKGESLIWRKYAPSNDEAHVIGAKLDKEERRYLGFSNAIVASIRNFRNTNGHGFKVEHVPKEGIFHAEVGYAPQHGVQFDKIQRDHMKLMLNDIFGKLLPWLRK